MTTQAPTPTTPAPAAAPSPASAPASEPAASSAATPSAPKSRKAALADSLVGVDTGDGEAPLEQPAAPDPKQPDPNEPPPAAAAPTREQVLREKLAKDREARQAKAQQDQSAARTKELEARIAAAEGKPTYEAFVEEFKRDPVGAARKVGMNPRALLDQLTEEALRPGSGAARAQAEQVDTEAKRAHERLDRYEAEQKQHAEAQRLQKNASDYVAATAPSADTKYPLLSKLPEARRLRLAQDAWASLQASEGPGYQFDLDTVAEAVEAQLEELHASWNPPAPPAAPAPTAPASTPSATQPSRAATKQPPRTLTPEITGASTATAKPRTKAERRKALEDSLVAVETD